MKKRSSLFAAGITLLLVLAGCMFLPIDHVGGVASQGLAVMGVPAWHHAGC